MDGDIVTEENLRRLSYVNLQRCAKMWGIKANAKAEKLITEIITEKEKNSGSPILLKDANAIAKESEVCQNSSGRLGRRRTRTFSVESPFDAKTPDVSCAILKTRSSRKSVKSNCTPTKISVKNIKSILSSKKCGKSIKLKNGNGHKVSFVTPDKMCGYGTPVSSPSTIRNRPQTPIAWKNVSTGEQSVFATSLISETPYEVEPLTFCDDEITSVNVSSILPSDKGPAKTKLKPVRTPNFKRIHQKGFEKMESVEEYEQRRQGRMHALNKSVKRQMESSKRFKCETVHKNRSKTCFDEVKENSKSMSLRPRKIASSKIPVPLQDIQFVPSVTSIKKIDTNFTKLTRLPKIQEPSSSSEIGNAHKKDQLNIKIAACQDKLFVFGKDSVQNVQPLPLVNATNTHTSKSFIRKNAFDLKASLAKKLPYKPYKGALKPLLDKNVGEKICATDGVPSLQSKAIANGRVIKRGILKGVRKNKRFELQMKHRCLAE